MSATAAPYGLKPVGLIGGQPYTGAFREYKMTVNSATGIFNGDIVGLKAGQPTAGAASPTTTISDNTPIGVCVGVRYVTPGLKQPMHAQFLPAGAITAGYTDVFIKIVDDPDVVFMVQGAGSIDRADIGLNAALGNFGAGSTVTGNSKINLVDPAATNTLAMRVVDVVDNIGNGSVPGDAYTDVLVKFNVGVHQYNVVLGQ